MLETYYVSSAKWSSVACAKEILPFGEEPTIKLEEENIYKTTGKQLTANLYGAYLLFT